MNQRKDLLSIILDVHMTKTGSYERSNENQESDLNILKIRLRDWKPSTLEKWRLFDDKVKELLMIAIAEPSWNESYRECHYCGKVVNKNFYHDCKDGTVV